MPREVIFVLLPFLLSTVYPVLLRSVVSCTQELTSPIMGLEDFERYSHDQMDNLRHLSLSVLESLSFEREALRWVVRVG